MALVYKDDIIAYIEQETNFTKGTAQSFQIILYRDEVGNQLNTQDATAIYVTIKNNNNDKLLQYSEPVVYGATDTLILGSGETIGYLDFEITALQSDYLTTGEIFAEITVVYDNYYPQSKTYILPPLKLGFALANPNEGNGDGTGTSTPLFNIEYVNGFNPTEPGKVSFNSSVPSEVSTIIFRNLDSNLVRLTLLENFLINRIQNENADGTITIMDTDDFTHYSVYKIQDWSRIDITPGDGDSDNTDGIAVNVVFEASSSGPGVSITSWQVGQNITFSLDSYGSTSNIVGSEGVLTYEDKNLSPNATTGNYAATGVYITYTPYSDSYVDVKINGLSVSVGDGVRTEDSYFSADEGVTALPIADITAGDQLIWNGDIVGYNLESGDEIDFIYEVDSIVSGSSGSNDVNGVLTYTDLNLNPASAIGNYAATGIYITYTPYFDSYIQVEINGLSVSVGDGVKTEDSYFSADEGVTALPIADVRAGDQLIWNAIIAGFNLDAGDEVNFIYEASSDDIV